MVVLVVVVMAVVTVVLVLSIISVFFNQSIFRDHYKLGRVPNSLKGESLEIPEVGCFYRPDAIHVAQTTASTVL